MTIREQAEYHRVLLAVGASSRDDVIAWADQLILSTTAPIEVIDLSLAVLAPSDELDRLLSRMPGEGDLTLAAHAALASLMPKVRRLPLEQAVGTIVRYGNAAMIPEPERHNARVICALYDQMLDHNRIDEPALRQEIDAFVDAYSLETAAE